MKLTMTRIGEPFHLEATTELGQKVQFDASPKIGGTDQGIRPTEALAASLAACSSIDVLYMLKKQRIVPEVYDVDIEVLRKEDEVPAVFESIHLKFKLKGVPLNKAERAVELSINKYCTVSKMLESSVSITSSIELIN